MATTVSGDGLPMCGPATPKPTFEEIEGPLPYEDGITFEVAFDSVRDPDKPVVFSTVMDPPMTVTRWDDGGDY